MIFYKFHDRVHPAVRAFFQSATDESAGYDLRANVATEVVMAPGARMLIDCGFSMEMQPGTFAMVCSRSGLAYKNGVIVLNSPGIIDSDYRGPIGAVLMNCGVDSFEIAPGDRIAQLVICSYVRDQFIPVRSLNDSERGANGFGSSGVK